MSEKISRNFKAIAFDISDGLVTVNPIFLKPFGEKGLKSLYKAIERKRSEIHAEPFPYDAPDLIRKRNMRLQRLHGALIVVKNFAREKNYTIL
ncbi:MAG: hypothetical protein C0415_06190 [Thermodesulfovibrio sp.]|nr:hypothetical protein [Thermodesulfovibrio sp.]